MLTHSTNISLTCTVEVNKCLRGCVMSSDGLLCLQCGTQDHSSEFQGWGQQVTAVHGDQLGVYCTSCHHCSVAIVLNIVCCTTGLYFSAQCRSGAVSWPPHHPQIKYVDSRSIEKSTSLTVKSKRPNKPEPIIWAFLNCLNVQWTNCRFPSLVFCREEGL